MRAYVRTIPFALEFTRFAKLRLLGTAKAAGVHAFMVDVVAVFGCEPFRLCAPLLLLALRPRLRRLLSSSHGIGYRLLCARTNAHFMAQERFRGIGEEEYSVSCVSHYYVVFVFWASYIKKLLHALAFACSLRESLGKFLATESMGASGYLLSFDADSSFITSSRRHLFSQLYIFNIYSPC